MSPDRAVVVADPPSGVAVMPAAGAVMPAPAVSAGWLEVALPLWHRKWRLIATTLLCAALAAGVSLTRPVRFTAQASFVVQPTARPSQSVVASALPALAGLVGGGSSPTDLHVAIMRSQVVTDRIIDRFNLQRVWGLQMRSQVHQRLARRISFGIGRRDGVVVVTAVDESAPRAAALANEYIAELRIVLRDFALEEARQRRLFYEAQLQRARGGLEQAQRKLQRGGIDRAALRAEPRAAVESYARLQAEVASGEVRLAAARRVRAEGSAEVQQLLAEGAALRQQLARIEVPPDDTAGSFVASVRDFRYAEALAESIARQAEAARVDEAAESVPVQLLDRARTPEWPSSPQPPLWLLAGALLGFVSHAAWVLVRHRMKLARLDPAYRQRLETIRSVLVRPRRVRSS